MKTQNGTQKIKENNGSKTVLEAEGPGKSQNVSSGSGYKPTIDDVRKWTRTDIKSAIAFLNLLYHTPGLVDRVADAIYEDAYHGTNLNPEG